MQVINHIYNQSRNNETNSIISRREIDEVPVELLAGWGNDLFEKDGTTLKKDIKNKDVSLRKRTLLNMDFITDLVYKSGEYLGGKLYMPKTGKTISCKMNGRWQIDNKAFYLDPASWG